MLRSKGGLSKSRTAAAEVATTTSTSLVEDEPSMIETDEASLSSSIASFSFKETLLDQTFYTAAGTTDDNDLSIHDDDGIASEDEDLDSVYYSKQKVCTHGYFLRFQN